MFFIVGPYVKRVPHKYLVCGSLGGGWGGGDKLESCRREGGGDTRSDGRQDLIRPGW